MGKCFVSLSKLIMNDRDNLTGRQKKNEKISKRPIWQLQTKKFFVMTIAVHAVVLCHTEVIFDDCLMPAALVLFEEFLGTWHHQIFKIV